MWPFVSDSFHLACFQSSFTLQCFIPFFKTIFLAIAHGLVSQPGINLTPPALEAQSLNH